MEARCQQAGVAAGQDADQLIAFAATLSEKDLRSVRGQSKVSVRGQCRALVTLEAVAQVVHKKQC